MHAGTHRRGAIEGCEAAIEGSGQEEVRAVTYGVDVTSIARHDHPVALQQA